jgi:hypothetical protein
MAEVSFLMAVLLGGAAFAGLALMIVAIGARLRSLPN